jgi:hypothetical protein
MKKSIDEMIDYLVKDCWTFDSWSEHPSGEEPYYVVKIKCGCQARARYQLEGATFSEALGAAYDKVITNWNME